MGKRKSREVKHAAASPDPGRRRLVLAGGGALAAAGAAFAGYRAGWFGQSRERTTGAAAPMAAGAGRGLAPATLPADAQNALRAANEMTEYYARDLDNASVLIHAVRGFGRNFARADGSKAVDHLCAKYAAEKEVGGKRYVYFTREAEVHENSFLKTFLEAGVSSDQPVLAGGNRYTLRDVGESAKALFRCDPENLRRYEADLAQEHLPWGLIAFSILAPPGQASWANAYGERIELPRVIDRGLADYEGACALGQAELERGEAEPKAFRDAIKKYSCFGLHSVYGFLSCLRHGYRGDGLPERARRMLDLTIYRMKGDAEAIDREYAAEGGGGPPHVVEAFRVRAQVKMLGHCLEAINYARLHQLFALTPAQERRIQAGEQLLYQHLARLRAMDWEPLRQTLGPKFVSDIVIALGHTARAMKLLTPDNPDTLA